MHYTSLLLRNFRSYSEYAVELSPSINIVVGPNASGKTNLLESILFASTGASFRARDKDLIAHSETHCKIVATTNEGVERSITLKQPPTEGANLDKTITIENKDYKRMGQQLSLPITLFEPEHMRMVHGSPERRREYLDSILMQTEPKYKKFLRDYKRVLAQRNKLLKRQGHIQKDELFVWDLKLSELGAYITKHRQALVDILNTKTSQTYTQLSDKKSQMQIHYTATIGAKDYASAALKALQESFPKDSMVGFTTIGPHRDDLWFELNGHQALSSASRGETRTIVLVCKLIELAILEESRGQVPILLLDDVFSELDSARRRSLSEYLKNYQTVITTTDADAIIKHFVGEYNILPVSKS